MRPLAILALTLVLSATAFAQSGSPPAASAGATCKAKAAEKHLSGAALTSTVKKCCETDAAKLRGAAKAAHIKKCIADAKA